MLIVMHKDANDEMVARVREEVAKLGLETHPLTGTTRVVIGVTGNRDRIDADRLKTLKGVRDVVHITEPFKLASREAKPESTVVEVGEVAFGGGSAVLMAGPCSVESRDQCFAIAETLAKAGVKVFRGGAYKPRTSPYSFQGLGEEGLEILSQVREEFGLKIVTEAVDVETLDLVASHTDIVQLGSRNMQNFSLLKKAGSCSKPVLLKRGMAATIEEFLMAAEYVLMSGNPNVILCERGIRAPGGQGRGLMDLAAIPVIQRMSHLPIVADPSHGTGNKANVPALARAALAAGADGLLIEVHDHPERALSDGYQSLAPADFEVLAEELRMIAPVVNRKLI